MSRLLDEIKKENDIKNIPPAGIPETGKRDPFSTGEKCKPYRRTPCFEPWGRGAYNGTASLS